MNYDNFHLNVKIQRKIIHSNNFTYRNTFEILLPILREKRLDILDYGCGVGTIDFFFASLGHKVTGLDISNKAIELCKLSAKEIGVTNNTSFHVLNFKLKRRFDLIICSEVIEHVVDDVGLLKKLSGLLKSNGYLFVSTPSLNAPLFKLGLVTDFDNRVGHLRRYDPIKLSKRVSEMGYIVVKLKKYEGIMRNSLFLFPSLNWIVKFLKGPISDFYESLDRLTLLLFGESNIYILARKK